MGGGGMGWAGGRRDGGGWGMGGRDVIRYLELGRGWRDVYELGFNEFVEFISCIYSTIYSNASNPTNIH
jgi:hypothetical protein